MYSNDIIKVDVIKTRQKPIIHSTGVIGRWAEIKIEGNHVIVDGKIIETYENDQDAEAQLRFIRKAAKSGEMIEIFTNPSQEEKEWIDRKNQWIEAMSSRTTTPEPKPRKNFIVSFFKGE